MSITDIFSSLYAVLHVDQWDNYGTIPGIWEYKLKYFKKNKEGIMIRKRRGDSITAVSGSLIFENQVADIIGWSKTDKDVRDNLFEDCVDLIEENGYRIIHTERYDEPREHNFRMRVRKIETR